MFPTKNISKAPESLKYHFSMSQTKTNQHRKTSFDMWPSSSWYDGMMVRSKVLILMRVNLSKNNLGDLILLNFRWLCK